MAVHHHLAELGDIARSGEESLARAWVESWRADIVSTTFVQVTNALFHATCADARRFSRLAGAILILDEVQAIPAELWTVFRTALRSLCENFHTDVLLVTATQPALFGESDCVEIGPEQFPPEMATACDRYDVCVEMTTPMSVMMLVQRIVREMSRPRVRSCLAILNTVQEALDLYRAAESDTILGRYRLFHLSTNLRPKDRRRILAELASCTDPHIVVATQVVEAGVDLSFDVVLRAIAPLDAIVQAAGRCNRHGAAVRGRVIVFAPEGNSAIGIYGSLHISLARQMLEEVVSSTDARSIPEPALAEMVRRYFAKLGERVQKDRASKIHDAIRQLEFAALRGEGSSQDRREKRIQLISDETDRVAHFVETDESDVDVSEALIAALGIEDAWQRRIRLRSLRKDIGLRIVEVPRRFAFEEPGEDQRMIRVPLRTSTQFYDTLTGWKR